MKLVVKTKYGTTFVLNTANLVWVKESPGHFASAFGNEGRLTKWPTIVVGEPLDLDVIGKGESVFTTGRIISGPVTGVFEVGPHDEEMYGIRIPMTRAETQSYIDNYSKTGAVGKDSPSKFVVPNNIMSSAVASFHRDEEKMKSVREHAAKMSAKPEESRVKHPHCDSDVLHAPGKCKFCDLYPARQNVRRESGTNFTGENHRSLLPCPSTQRRTLDKIEKWPGNRPYKVGATDHAKSPKPGPVTQADGFAEAPDPLEFATLPGGGKLRYTDDTRTTFRYIPKGWADLGPQDEPRKATVCTRNEGHNGPCNGFPRLEREGMCYNSRPNVLVALFHSPNGGYTTLHLVKGTTVTYIAVRETTFAGQVECIRRNAGELEALVYTNSYIFESALNKRGIETRMIQSALLPNGR